jgi:DNA-binding Lrp family transcriptional regulator
MDYFVNRDNELDAFRNALEMMCDKNKKPPVLLFHGASGMGKTWLIQECRRIAENHVKKPFTIYLDCNRTNMTLEVLFNDIHTELEKEFKKYFDEYLKFLETIDEIEKEVEKEVTANPENAHKIASVVSAVASKAISAVVPGAAALVGEQNIKGATDVVTGLAAEGITALRQKFADKKLDRQKYRLFLKDLQAEQSKKLAEILNKIAVQENRKIILFVDRFEKLATAPNTRSDMTFYEYWRDCFVHHLSKNILLVQGGRIDLEDDYQLHLRDVNIRSFELKRFTERDILKIFSHLKVLQQQMQEYEDFVKLLIEKTMGYPVAIGVLKGQIQGISSIAKLETIKQEVFQKETRIIEMSINWFLDNSLDAKYRETVYKLAICCSRSGEIDRKAIEYIFNKANMPFPEVESALRQLSQQYSFIDCIQGTMHELVREFILRYLNLKDKKYIRTVNAELRTFYQIQAEETRANG